MSPMQALSLECQRRGFNPQWREWQTADNRFGCEAIIHGVRGVNIKDARLFQSAQEAKWHAATEGLEALKKVPFARVPAVPSEPSKQQKKQSTSVVQPTAKRNNVAQAKGRANTPRPGGLPGDNGSAPKVKREQHEAMDGVCFTIGQSKPNGDRSTSDRVKASAGNGSTAGEEQRLMSRLFELFGSTVTDHSRDPPEVARAFLEGMAVGARLAAPQHAPSPRGRSRSPQAPGASSLTYRARSPLRGERDRATPPSGHHHQPSRRITDRYRPANAASEQSRPSGGGGDAPRGSGGDKVKVEQRTGHHRPTQL